MARVMSSATCSSFSELPTRCFTMVSKSDRLMRPSRSTSYTFERRERRDA